MPSIFGRLKVRFVLPVVQLALFGSLMHAGKRIPMPSLGLIDGYPTLPYSLAFAINQPADWLCGVLVFVLQILGAVDAFGKQPVVTSFTINIFGHGYLFHEPPADRLPWMMAFAVPLVWYWVGKWVDVAIGRTSEGPAPSRFVRALAHCCFWLLVGWIALVCVSLARIPPERWNGIAGAIGEITYLLWLGFLGLVLGRKLWSWRKARERQIAPV